VSALSLYDRPGCDTYVPSSFSFRDDAVPLILLAYMGLTQAMKGFVVRRYGWQ